MFLIHILEMILLLIVPVGVVGMLAAIIALSLESNCLDNDTEYSIECRRTRDQKIFIRNILGYILLAPIALLIVIPPLGLICEFLYKKFKAVFIKLRGARAARGVSV